MSEPRGRIYELALRALDEQDRQVGDLRGRLAPVLAAGGVGLTLLTRPAFSGAHPSGANELVATIAGLLGAAALVLAGAYVLHPGGSRSASTPPPPWKPSAPATPTSSTTRTSSTRP
jgi:hypothetical protein